MARAEMSTVINRPIEDVFAVLSKVENNPKWSSAALEAEQTSAGPIGVGTTLRFVGRFLGRRVESRSVVTQFESNRQFGWQSSAGPFPMQGSLTFERVNGGTRVNSVFEAKPAGFFKLVEPLMVRMATRRSQNDLENLKRLMEADAL
jgi:uncharacterized membrane protein